MPNPHRRLSVKPHEAIALSRGTHIRLSRQEKSQRSYVFGRFYPLAVDGEDRIESSSPLLICVFTGSGISSFTLMLYCQSYCARMRVSIHSPAFEQLYAELLRYLCVPFQSRWLRFCRRPVFSWSELQPWRSNKCQANSYAAFLPRLPYRCLRRCCDRGSRLHLGPLDRLHPVLILQNRKVLVWLSIALCRFESRLRYRPVSVFAAPFPESRFRCTRCNRPKRPPGRNPARWPALILRPAPVMTTPFPSRGFVVCSVIEVDPILLMQPTKCILEIPGIP